jgi:hypothetical protein
VNTQSARKILLLYRPGTADANEPEFAEALDFARQDENLHRWFGEHCATQEVIRSRFKLIPVPEALREQIISERPWQPLIVSKREVFALAGFVAAVVLVCFALLWSRPPSPVNTGDNLAAFQSRMVSTVLRAYPAMDLVTSDLNQIRAFLTEHSAHGDYVLPAGLGQVAATGCTTISWHGKQVSMICFKSGRPLAPGQTSDVWLFVTDRSSLSDAPAGDQPQIASFNRVTTACWTRGDKTYVLAAEGNEEFLRNYF